MSKSKGKLKQRDKDSSKTVGLSVEECANLIDNSPPAFSFRYLQRGYCVDCCEKNEKASLADTLFRLSGLSWA